VEMLINTQAVTVLTFQTRQTVYVKLRRVRATIVAVEKARNITYSECMFVGLVIQHEMRMRHIAICGLPRYTIFFPHYLINGTILGKKLLNTKCVF
jgi:hypothetical protein